MNLEMGVMIFSNVVIFGALIMLGFYSDRSGKTMSACGFVIFLYTIIFLVAFSDTEEKNLMWAYISKKNISTRDNGTMTIEKKICFQAGKIVKMYYLPETIKESSQ